jgi:hypothetical protein
VNGANAQPVTARLLPCRAIPQPHPFRFENFTGARRIISFSQAKKQSAIWT